MNLDDYVGLPWAERGRDRAGLDCWGLFGLVYRERLGIDLPSLRDDYLTVVDAALLVSLIEGNMGPWIEVPAGAERPGDGLMMTIGRQPRHIGVIQSPGFVLHIECGAGAVIESYRSVRLARRLAGIFRHESLA